MKHYPRGPAGSFVVAVVIVGVAMIALVASDDPTQRHWRPIAAPVIPAVYLLGSFFIGGAHGITLTRFEQAGAISGIALFMWWVLIEGGRRVFRRLRGITKARRA